MDIRSVVVEATQRQLEACDQMEAKIADDVCEAQDHVRLTESTEFEAEARHHLATVQQAGEEMSTTISTVRAVLMLELREAEGEVK